MYGPHNATLYASRSAQQHVTSLGHFFHTPADTLAIKLGLAASSYELVAGIPSVVAYFGPDRDATWREVAAHEEKLQHILLEFLSRRGNVTIYGEPSADKELRVPVVSFSVEGRSSKEIVEGIERRSDFACRWGSFYSMRLVDEVLGLGGEGMDGVVRVSMVHYNTEEEISGFVKVLDGVLSEKA